MAYRQHAQQLETTTTTEPQHTPDQEEIKQSRQTAVSPLAAMGDDPNTHATALNQKTNGNLARAGDALLQLQKQYGNQYVQRLINPRQQLTVQPKLMLGAPDTPHEREAEEMSNQLANGGTATASPTPVTGAQTAVSAATEATINQARGSGGALNKNVRESLESSFGVDLGGVRVHTDSRSDALNQSLSARAFTTGQDIFFRRGEYDPSSSRGQRILTHEITHVLQQNPSLGQYQSTASNGYIQRTLNGLYTRTWLTNQVTINNVLEDAQLTNSYQNLCIALQNYRAHVGDDQERTMLELLKKAAINAQNEMWVQIVSDIEEFIEQVKKEPLPQGKKENENDVPQIGTKTEIITKERKPMATISQLQSLVKKYVQNQEEFKIGKKLFELRRIAHYATQLIYWEEQYKDTIEWLDEVLNWANKNYAAYLPRVGSTSEEERHTVIVHQGQGAMGHLGRVVLISNYFLSCIPVVMFNQKSKLGGLFHVSSGQSVIMNQASELLELAKAISPTHIFINQGSQGSGEKELNALLQFFSTKTTAKVSKTDLKISKIRITLNKSGNWFSYAQSTQATKSKFDMYNIRDEKELTQLPSGVRAYTSKEVEYYEPEKDAFAQFKHLKD